MTQPTNSQTDDDGLAGLTDAMATVADGDPVVIVAETPDGSASKLVELIPETIEVHSGVACAFASRGAAGNVATELGLDDFKGGAIVLEEAQWADPTSLGRIQRLAKDGPKPFLLVVAHRPLSDVDDWWFDQLAETAGRDTTLVELALDPEPEPTDDVPLEGQEIDLVIAARLIAGPLPVPVASGLLGVPEAEVFSMADDLVARGLLTQSRSGYLPAPGTSGSPVGEARIGYVADRLATALAGQNGDPSVIGHLRAAADQPEQAFPLLAQAARDAEARHAGGEAYHLGEAALAAAEEAGIEEEETLGELHLVCGRFLRTAGRTAQATHHLELATARLEGLAKVEALGLSSNVADDAQHPQDAERLVAMAQAEAIRLGETGWLGSLLAFHARVLHRIGFAAEADAALAKGRAILQDGEDPGRVFAADVNRAWIHFDRGEAAVAADEFTRLRDEARPLEGNASVADKEAWRARALFASGHPTEALEAVQTVQTLSAEEDVEAPLFLAQLALTEGGTAYGHYEAALEAAEHALDLVERQLPAWENMARAHRATALLRLGRSDEALTEIDRALEATPPGPNGWRWRTRCQALRMEIATAAGEKWPEERAEDLADLMLQSRLYGWAAEMLCAIAENGKRKGAAAEALGLASQIGRPVVAARAAQAGSLWSAPDAAHAILAIRAIDTQIPETWQEGWNDLPHVNRALTAPDPVDDEATETATAALDEALAAAGLADTDTVLSPAQRRSHGLVRRSRRIHPLRLIAATLGIIVVAGGTAFGVNQLTATDDVPSPTLAPPAATATSTVPEPLTLEETQIPLVVGSRGLFGESKHRGGASRNGVVSFAGPREVAGYYWATKLDGPVEAALVTYGNNVYASTTEGTFYALDMETGEESWHIPPEGRISTSPDWGRGQQAQSTDPMIMIIATESGVIRAHDATSTREFWTTRLDTAVKSSPVVAGEIGVVATEDGYVYGFDLQAGGDGPLWTFPEGDEGLGFVSADLTYDNGTLYVGTREGLLWMIDLSSEVPAEICRFDAENPIMANPVVADGIVYVSTTGQTTWTLSPGVCETNTVTGRLFQYAEDYPVDNPPAVVGDIMYLPQWRYLYGKDLATNRPLWDAGALAVADAQLTTPPVVAGDMVYFASADGVVHALDATTGETQWTWDAGVVIRSAPAVIDGVVFIATTDGFVYAVGP